MARPWSELPLPRRLAQTLQLAHRRGFGLTPKTLARWCLGGPADLEDVEVALRADPRFVMRQGVCVLADHGHLIAPTLDRMAVDPQLHARTWAIATDFSRRLVDQCPWVRVVMVSGSLGAGAFLAADDIDFNLVVEDGTKYLTYALALAGATRMALDHQLPEDDVAAQLPLLRKVVCLNVIWEESQTRPFSRTDPYLGFELLQCVPLYGARAWESLLSANPWLQACFPQLQQWRWADVHGNGGSGASRMLAALTTEPGRRAHLDDLARYGTSLLHRYVNAGRATSRPQVLQRVRRMEEYKFPYGFFQEGQPTPVDLAPPLP